jgi:hypothetical protein
MSVDPNEKDLAYMYQAYGKKPHWQRHANATKMIHDPVQTLWKALDHDPIARKSDGSFKKHVQPHQIKLILNKNGQKVALYKIQNDIVKFSDKDALIATESSPKKILERNAKQGVYSVFFHHQPTFKPYAPTHHTQEFYYRANEPDVELSKTQYESLTHLLEEKKETSMGTTMQKKAILQTWTGDQLKHHYLNAPEDKEGEKNIIFSKKQDVYFKPSKLRIILPFSPDQPGLLAPAQYTSGPEHTMFEQWITNYASTLL